MNKTELMNIISALLKADSVSGDEKSISNIATTLLSDSFTVKVNSAYNLTAEVCRNHNAKEHIMLDAHMDEIGLVVTSVDDNGFLRVSPYGGVDTRLCASAEVTVYGERPLRGIIASLPPHLCTDDKAKKAMKPDEILIDIGYSKKQAEKLVSPGDNVVFCGEVTKLLGSQITSKALDDRAGCAAVMCAALMLRDIPLGCNVTLNLSTQEEVGIRGAKTTAYTVSPTMAITVDVSYGNCPNTPPDKCGKIGEGPMIGFSPVLDREMSRELVNIAKEKSIACQYEIMSEETGTNADAISLSKSGVKTALLSIPLKYMHSPVEVVDVDDIFATAQLIFEYVKKVGGCNE